MSTSVNALPASLKDTVIEEVLDETRSYSIYKSKSAALGESSLTAIFHMGSTIDTDTSIKLQQLLSFKNPYLLHYTNIEVNENDLILTSPFPVEKRILSQLEQNGPIDIASAIPLLKSLAEAISELHKYNLLLGLLSTKSIFIDSSFNPCCAFWGIQSLQKNNLENLLSDGEGLYYIAPEVITSSAYSPLSDVYSFGAFAYKIILGRHAFEANTSDEVLTKKLSGKPISLNSYIRGLPETTGEMLAACLSASVDGRPGRFDDILAVLNGSSPKASEHNYNDFHIDHSDLTSSQHNISSDQISSQTTAELVKVKANTLQKRRRFLKGVSFVSVIVVLFSMLLAYPQSRIRLNNIVKTSAGGIQNFAAGFQNKKNDRVSIPTIPTPTKIVFGNLNSILNEAIPACTSNEENNWLPDEYISANCESDGLHLSSVSEDVQAKESLQMQDLKDTGNYAIKLETQQVSGSSDHTHTYGILLRSQSSNPGAYLFDIDSQGGWNFGLWDTTGNFHTIKKGIAQSLETGNSPINDILITAENDTFVIYLNDEYVATLKDATYQTGSIALTVSTINEEISFSNLRISKLP